MSENVQYDHLLGGNQELPGSIQLFHFTAARCKEIQTLKQSLVSSKGTKLAFQKLPTHMRRRVMSHNAKRLPQRLREIHLNQLKKSGLGTKQKRPSRKYRRRPQNLLAEYARRQRRCKWLETHIWHAKRFHMIEKWGYKLPYSPCDKAFRACYRASAKHCLLEDISYIGCIEITAQENYIIDQFSKICDKNVNMGIGAKAFISGRREGKLTLFTNGIPVTDVNFHWMPKNHNLTSTLWLWVHAASFNSILNLLINLFNLHFQNFTSRNCYKNCEDNVSLYDLRYELNRFRLTGPLSHAVLQRSLVPANLQNENIGDWFKSYINENLQNIFTNQIEYWKCLENISSVSEISPHIIIGLIANDPRYNMPKKRTKILTNNSHMPSLNIIESLPEYLSQSPIWSDSVRKYVKDNKVSSSYLCELRRKLLIPGTDLDVPPMLIPYLLVQRPGNRSGNIGFCSGWDIILPSGWAQPTWLTLIMYGARAGGLREAESISFEMGLPSILEPDTESGETEDVRCTNLYRQRYFNLPPNKRVNYNKFSITSPFECKWKVLLRDWNCFPIGAKRFYVLRDKKLLHMIQDTLSKNSQLGKLDVNFQVPYIVPVRLVLEKKGCPMRYSIICLPKQEDLQKGADIKELKKTDSNQAERSNLRFSHKLLLKKLSRYRKRCRLLGKDYIPKVNYIEEYKRKIENLWIPDVQSEIRQSCSREIIGWPLRLQRATSLRAPAWLEGPEKDYQQRKIRPGVWSRRTAEAIFPVLVN
ncbi:hypothetical protein Trydic_g11008 [Trypoxylus dichotomus]